eukprot:s3083_g5.t1
MTGSDLTTSTFPVEPRAEALPAYNSFSSMEAFPSLEALGVRNGQEIFLSMSEAPPAPAVKPSSPRVATPSLPPGGEDSAYAPGPAEPPAPVQPVQPAQPPVRPAQPAQPAQPAPTPPTAPKPAGPSSSVRYSDEHKLKFLWRSIEEKKLALTKARELREYNEVQRVRESPETDRLAALLLWQTGEQEFYCRMKADLDRAVGLQPVKEFIVQRLRDAAGRHVLKEGKQPRRHVLISGAFGVGKHVAAELIGRLFGLLNNQLVAQVRVGSKVRLAAWQDPKNRGALLSKNDVGIVTEEMPHGSPEPLKVKGPSGRVGNYRADELVAEQDLLNTITELKDLLDPKTGKLRVADRSCFYMRLGGALTEQDAEILEQVLDVGSVVIMAGPPEVVEANMQLSAFRRRQPDLLTLPTLSVNDVANLIAMEVEKRGYEGVGEGDVGTRQLITVLEHIVAQRFDEKLIREKNGHLARDVLETWLNWGDCAIRMVSRKLLGKAQGVVIVGACAMASDEPSSEKGVSAEPAQSETVADVSTVPSPAKASTEVPEVVAAADPAKELDVERFSKLPIEKRTMPAEKWEEEVTKKSRRFVAFQHLGLHCRSRVGQTKDNIVIGVLFFNSSNERLHNGEQFLKWRLTDLAQPEPRNITVHLRWQACVHWRKAENAKKASRGAIMAILNPHLIEFDNKWGRDGKETLLLVETPLTIEKLGECPALGSCKKKGCKLPCNLLQREAYCRRHLDEIYAAKSVRVATGGANVKAAAVLGRKRSISQIEREVKAAKMEAAARDDAQEGDQPNQEENETVRNNQERQKRLELALHLDDRRFLTAEANESYVKFVRKGMKSEDANMSRVPQLGRGLESSDGLEILIPSFPSQS